MMEGKGFDALDPDRVVVLEHQVTINKMVVLAGAKTADFIAPASRDAGRSFAANIMREFSVFSDKDTPAARELTFRCAVIRPDDNTGISFSNQLEQSRRQGMMEAAAFVLQQAALFAAAGNHGPVQALALNGVAKELRKLANEG